MSDPGTLDKELLECSPRLVPITIPAPEDRPRCPFCDKELRPYYHVVWTPDGEAERQFKGAYRGFYDFCSVTCAGYYGVNKYREEKNA